MALYIKNVQHIFVFFPQLHPGFSSFKISLAALTCLLCEVRVLKSKGAKLEAGGFASIL